MLLFHCVSIMCSVSRMYVSLNPNYHNPACVWLLVACEWCEHLVWCWVQSWLKPQPVCVCVVNLGVNFAKQPKAYCMLPNQLVPIYGKFVWQLKRRERINRRTDERATWYEDVQQDTTTSLILHAHRWAITKTIRRCETNQADIANIV